jgi:transposase-like protein
VPEGAEGDFDHRNSFCCSGRDCRKRLTPTSVRFLNSRVYLSIVVVLAAVLAQGLSRGRVKTLCEELGVDRRTLARWRAWWQEELPRTDYWTELRLRLCRQPDSGSLPTSLLELMEAEDEQQRLQQLLHLLEPLSHSRLMRQRFSRAA